MQIEEEWNVANNTSSNFFKCRAGVNHLAYICTVSAEPLLNRLDNTFFGMITPTLRRLYDLVQNNDLGVI